MGKIEKLFGVQTKDIVDKLPNKALKKSIASGNYGYKKANVSFDTSNKLFQYLVDPKNEKNIVYWHQEIEKDQFHWAEMREYFVDIGLKRKGEFHPSDYGFTKCSCSGGFFCNDCHKGAIKTLYEYYRKNMP